MPGRKNIGVLWDDEVVWDHDVPFDHKNTEDDYAVYTELGWERGLELYIARFNWYDNTKLKKAWHWNGDKWEQVHDIPLEGVYDKYRYDSETRKLKEEIASELPVLNDPELEYICKDKLETYRLFPEHVPETVIATEPNAEKMLEKHERIVFKPRYGAAGKGVEIIDSLDEFDEPGEPEEYIIQQFISTEGIPSLGVEGPHDMRTHVVNGELLEGNYVRVPREGLISNVSRGGNQMYIDNEDIPEEAKDIIDDIADMFEEYEPNIFAVDFMFDDDGKPWMVELNSKPGMYYHYPVKKKEYELPRMEKLVDLLKEMVS